MMLPDSNNNHPSMTSGNLKRKQSSDQKIDLDLSSDSNKKSKMMPSNQYLLAFHLVTCGLQNNDLGRDETAILQMGFQLIDVAQAQALGGKLILLQASSLIDPSANPDKIHISVPAREMTELLGSPNSHSTINLQEALMEIDHFIHDIIPKDIDQIVEIIPVTLGHLPLRSVLHRETRFRNIQLNDYWNRYYDLCDQVLGYCEVPVHSLEEITEVLQIGQPGLTTTSIIWNMTTSILRLLQLGHVFHSLKTIKNGYQPIVFHVDDEIESDVVIMIKPIDYRTPISQVIPFFRGLNIADGGIAVVMADGRRSNKILVKFEDKIQRDISLLRDKHHMEPGNTRFITISTFDSREFMKIAGYQDENVRKYLQQIQHSDQILIRIKGLPYTVTKHEILEFFHTNEVEVQFQLDGIFLVQKPSGELNGDAFIIFQDEYTAQKAKNLKGMTIGNRYMEIFYSTPPEMNQVIAAANKNISKTKPALSSMKTNESVMNTVLKTSSVSDSKLSATFTKFVPIDATDSDFIRYLSDFQGLCLKISRSNLCSLPGYISYIALFKCSSDAKLVVKGLSDKLFKVDLTNKEVNVETVEFLLGNPVEDKSNIYNRLVPKLVTSPLPINNYLSAYQNILPYSPYLLQTPATVQNALNMTTVNGPIINYGGIPNVYLGNQQLNLLPYNNLLMINQMALPTTIPSGSNVKFLTSQDLLTNPIQTNNTWSDLYQTLPIVTSAANKSKILLMSGITMRLSQPDLDIMFHSIASNVSMLPKLLQHNQLFYAVFSSVEDANIALQRCPIILYNNQVIQLIPTSD